MGVDYTQLVPVLIEAVKEQQKQIEGLKAENSQLRTENEKIKTKLSSIESHLAALEGKG